jgi:hypothetical protein
VSLNLVVPTILDRRIYFLSDIAERWGVYSVFHTALPNLLQGHLKQGLDIQSNTWQLAVLAFLKSWIKNGTLEANIAYEEGEVLPILNVIGHSLKNFEQFYFFQQHKQIQEDIACTYTTPFLEVLRHGIREYSKSYQDNNLHIKKEVFVEILKAKALELEADGKLKKDEFSDNLASAMFTIVKDVNHNPRAKS